VSVGLFFNVKELWQSPLLIDYKIKYSRPNRRPARSASGLGDGLANMFSFRVLDIFPSEDAFFITVTYMFGRATYFGWHAFLGIQKSALAKDRVHFLIILS
jgi:hypothetical protein